MIDFFVPRENVNDTSVIIKKIYVDNGSYVTKGDLVVDLETSKTIISIEAIESGYITHSISLMDEINIGEKLYSISKDNVTTIPPPQHFNENNADYIFSKEAQQLAKQLGLIDQKYPSKWVTVDDVRNAAGLEPASIPQPKFKKVYRSTGENTSTHSDPEFEIIKISKRKKVEILNLTSGSHEATSSTIGVKIELPGNRIVAPPPLFSNSITDLVIYEASRLLQKFPELNGCYLDEDSWAHFHSVNFGISFDSDRNLKVLRILNTDHIKLQDLQAELLRLLELYESNLPIPLEFLNDSTITISDLSGQDISFMLPLINGRQSAIIGITKQSDLSYQIFITFDHRLSEGLTVSKFLSELRDRIYSYYFDQNGIPAVYCTFCQKELSEELRLGNKGFIKMVLRNGIEGNVCRSCFDGW